MKPLELLATARAPDGEELKLMRRDGDFMIVLDRNELMNSRMSGSEEALATMTAERLGPRAGQNWLIGGYGMGFTLRAALAALGQHATLTVAELVPEIVGWARGPMAELTAGCLDDPRVSVVMADVADVGALGNTRFGRAECHAGARGCRRVRPRPLAGPAARQPDTASDAA